jgi:hypothetical protein
MRQMSLGINQSRSNCARVQIIFKALQYQQYRDTLQWIKVKYLAKKINKKSQVLKNSAFDSLRETYGFARRLAKLFLNRGLNFQFVVPVRWKINV